MLGVSGCRPARVSARSPVLVGKDGVRSHGHREASYLQCPLPYLVPKLGPQLLPHRQQQEVPGPPARPVSLRPVAPHGHGCRRWRGLTQPNAPKGLQAKGPTSSWAPSAGAKRGRSCQPQGRTHAP